MVRDLPSFRRVHRWYLLQQSGKEREDIEIDFSDYAKKGIPCLPAYIHAQTYVVEKGADYWKLLRDWNSTNRKLTAKEIGILDAACAIPRRIPSEKQAQVLITAENRAKTEGFFPG